MRRRNPPPAATPGGSWQTFTLAVTEDGQREFVLPYAPELDGDGDALVRVEYSGGSYNSPGDFSISGATLTWADAIPLMAGESLNVWIVPAGT